MQWDSLERVMTETMTMLIMHNFLKYFGNYRNDRKTINQTMRQMFANQLLVTCSN
jgi:hypothetical protein